MALRIEIVKGDITSERVDAIVNAANPTLMGGGGVDGAIHRAGGPSIVEECKRIREQRYPQGLPTGQAVATTAGDLAARWVIHTVGPIYASDPDPASNLAAAYRSSLQVAAELGARTMAFPAISAGVYGFPLEPAADIALRTVAGSTSDFDEVRFVLFNDAAHQAFADAYRRLGMGSSDV